MHGVELVANAAAVYAAADLIVKVKEPVGPELDLLRSDQRLFSYLHLATNEVLTRRLIDIGLTAIAFETIHATDYRDPSYQWEGVTHFAVTNMPGAVPRTASQVLSAAVLPYTRILAGGDWSSSDALQRGINVQAGMLCYPALQDLFPNLSTG